MNVHSHSALRQSLSIHLDTDKGCVPCVVRRCEIDVETGQVTVSARAEMPFAATVLGYVFNDLDLGYTLESDSDFEQKTYHAGFQLVLRICFSMPRGDVIKNNPNARVREVVPASRKKRQMRTMQSLLEEMQEMAESIQPGDRSRWLRLCSQVQRHFQGLK